MPRQLLGRFLTFSTWCIAGNEPTKWAVLGKTSCTKMVWKASLNERGKIDIMWGCCVRSLPCICWFLMARAASSISSKQQTTSCRTLSWTRPNENCNWVWSWVIQQPFGLFSTIEFSFIWNIKTKQRSGNMADVAWVRGSEGAAGFTFIWSTCVGQQLQQPTYLPAPHFQQ